jgi:hypothetical protein
MAVKAISIPLRVAEIIKENARQGHKHLVGE